MGEGLKWNKKTAKAIENGIGWSQGKSSISDEFHIEKIIAKGYK